MEEVAIRKTFTYPLKPTRAQARGVEEVVWRCRERYHAGLQERKAAWEQCGVSVNFAMQSAQLPGIKAARSEYQNINAQVLQEMMHRLDKAFQSSVRRIKAGEKPGYPRIPQDTPGYPRFQGKDRYHSFTYPQMGEPGGAVLDDGVLSLSKVGRIPVRMHRPLEGTPKTVTISREADGWYASISCTEVPVQPLPATGRETGIDVGIKAFLITADGEAMENPHYYRKAEKRLAKAPRRAARRTRGSKRRGKAVKVLARAHQHVGRQRRDFHHKTALILLRNYDTIYLEDLRVANMIRNQGLAKSIADAGRAQFRTILEAKAACAGRRVVAVPPAYTSQDCSGCGARVPKSLSIRTHVCTSCGLVLDRDENAARNIQWAGQALWGVGALAPAVNREAPSL